MEWKTRAKSCRPEREHEKKEECCRGTYRPSFAATSRASRCHSTAPQGQTKKLRDSCAWCASARSFSAGENGTWAGEPPPAAARRCPCTVAAACPSMLVALRSILLARKTRGLLIESQSKTVVAEILLKKLWYLESLNFPF